MSVLPTLLKHESEARFSKIAFTDNQIFKILRALDINNTHGHDKISIRMLKLCDKSIITPLSILFQNSIDTRNFPDTWRSQILCLFTKKVTRRLLIIIDQSPCYPFLEKFLKEFFSIHFLSILKRIIYFVLISLVSDCLILVNINFSQYCMKIVNLFNFIVIHQKMSGVFS